MLHRILFKTLPKDSLSLITNKIYHKCLIDGVISSLEVTNEEPVSGDASTITNEEIKERAKAYYAMQTEQ